MDESEDEISPPPPPPPSQTPTQQTPHTEVIQRGNGPVSVSTDTNCLIKVLPPKTAKEILARERERKARTTLLMALPEDHLAKFHKMTDAKEMWEAIKSRFGGNDESKKMQKYILKQQFEGFSVSNLEGLHKGYDMFQSLLSQLEIHGTGVSTEDVNQKFLRSLPSSWSQVSLIMRTKPGVDSLNFNDLYNNLRVFECDVKGSTASSSSTQNDLWIYPKDYQSFKAHSDPVYKDLHRMWHSFQRILAVLMICPQLDHEDLEQLDEFDLEEMDLKWQLALISMRMKKLYKKTGQFARECRSKGYQDSRRRDAWNTGNKEKYNGRRSGKQEDSKALVTLDGEGVDWTSHSEDEHENYAFMACNSSGSDIEKVEAQLVAHQQSQLWYEEKIRFMKIDLDDKTDVLTYHKKLLAEAEKEKEDLKAKVEKWHNSSKNLNILLNSQMSARDKAGLGYGDQLNKGVLSYENEVFQSVFVSRTSETENNPVNDRYAEGMHVVPPPMTGIYIPSGPDKEIDDSQFTYGPKQSKPSESDARSSDFNSCESNCSEETHESMPVPVVNEPKVVSEPKVWSDAPIIEEYESDSEDEHVSLPTKEQETPSFAFINTVKHVKTPRQTVKEQNTCSQSPKPDKKDFSDCNFHEKMMAKQAELNNRMSKASGQRKIMPLVLLGEKGKLLLSPQQVVIGDIKDITGTKSPNTMVDQDYPQRALQNKGIVDSGCSRHMTRNKAYLAEYQDFNDGPVAFGVSKGYITGKGKIKTGKLDFEDVCFVKELQHFNLFSVSQMCDKKNKVLFTDTECLACLIAKATIVESNKWHRRLGHVNFKNLNKLVKGNLVRGLPSKIFQNDHTCIACQKGKQHKASCKAKSVSSISQPLQLLHMDLFRPTSVFFLRTKDETSGILKDFIRRIEKQLNQKVKSIRCDNGTEFKNKDFIEFCGSKGIKREYSNARTPQQNGVAERKNMTLIEAARTMLADSFFLPNDFWAEVDSTMLVCPNSYIRPFGCHVTILNTIDHLGKFDGKSDEGFLVGYSLQSKAFRVYNLETKRVEENLHITFLENKLNVAGKGPTWLFNLDYLTDSMNYQHMRSENQANKHAGPKEANHNVGTKANIDAGNSEIEDESTQDYFVLPIWSSYTSTIKSSKAKNAGKEPNKNYDLKTDENPVDKEEQVFLDELERLKRQEQDANDAAEALRKEFAKDTEDLLLQAGAAKASSTNTVNTASTPVSTDKPKVSTTDTSEYNIY
ncbi:putative ribonuclease H-like domain-containing protein [Tanacetum coccineum]